MIFIDLSNIDSVRLINSKKSFSFLTFLICILLGFLPLIIYLIYYLAKDEDVFNYAIKYKDGRVEQVELKKNDVYLKPIRDIEARNFFNNN